MTERPLLSADEVLNQLVAWGREDENVRRLVLVGSRAGGGADELSDIDLQVYARSRERYTRDESWLAEIAPVWVCVRDEYRDGELLVPTRLVIFAGGVKVDFAFYPAGAVSEGIRAGLPHRVLLDKDPAAGAPLAAGRSVPPTAAEFRRVVEEFWFEAYHVAKYLTRADLGLAKERDWATKRFLLRMIEWRESDEDLRAALRPCNFEREEGWTALLATMDLFRRLATATAARFGFPYPVEVDRNLSGLVLGLRDSSSRQAASPPA